MGAAITPLRHVVMGEVTIFTFALMVVLITLLYNLVFLAVFHKAEEFSYLWDAVAARIPALGRISRKGGPHE